MLWRRKPDADLFVLELENIVGDKKASDIEEKVTLVPNKSAPPLKKSMPAPKVVKDVRKTVQVGDKTEKKPPHIEEIRHTIVNEAMQSVLDFQNNEPVKAKGKTPAVPVTDDMKKTITGILNEEINLWVERNMPRIVAKVIRETKASEKSSRKKESGPKTSKTPEKTSSKPRL